MIKDYSRTLFLPSDAPNLTRKLEMEFRRLEQRARAELRREGFSPGEQRLGRQLDLRYRGQGYEITLPYARDFRQAFHRAHERRYSYADTARAVEVVGVRLRGLGLTQKPSLPRRKLAGAAPRAALVKKSQVWFGGRSHQTDFYVREKFQPGNRFHGPAVVAEYSATTVVPPGWQAQVDPYGSLLLTRTKK